MNRTNKLKANILLWLQDKLLVLLFLFEYLKKLNLNLFFYASIKNTYTQE